MDIAPPCQICDPERLPERTVRPEILCLATLRFKVKVRFYAKGVEMSADSTMRLGMVQAHGRAGDDAPKMLDDALAHVEEGAARGVDLLVFPETNPGPVSWHTRYDVLGPMSEAAAKHGMYLVVGTTEKADGDERAYHIASVLIGRDGEIVGRYRRTHPGGTYYRNLYGAGPFWEFDYVPADDLPVFDLPWGKLGISICSEVFAPQVAHGLSRQGAELIVFPTGCLIDDLTMTENWQTLIRARAIENNIYTATCLNLFDEELRLAHVNDGFGLKPVDPATGLNSGHAMIASPEYVLGKMRGVGILTADLDLAYVRKMQAEPEFPEGVVLPPPYITLPGIHNLDRPDLARKSALAEREPEVVGGSRSSRR
jgi:predicted amidohydrolase